LITFSSNRFTNLSQSGNIAWSLQVIRILRIRVSGNTLTLKGLSKDFQDRLPKSLITSLMKNHENHKVKLIEKLQKK
jgi:hypothetical protein